jgi:hypothetical protein
MDRLWEPVFDLRLWFSGGVDLGEMFWLRREREREIEGDRGRDLAQKRHLVLGVVGARVRDVAQHVLPVQPVPLRDFDQPLWPVWVGPGRWFQIDESGRGAHAQIVSDCSDCFPSRIGEVGVTSRSGLCALGRGAHAQSDSYLEMVRWA